MDDVAGGGGGIDPCGGSGGTKGGVTEDLSPPKAFYAFSIRERTVGGMSSGTSGC